MRARININRIPPVLCRLLAKIGRRPMSTIELSDRSGIPAHMIEAYSWSTSWDDIKMGDAFAFAEACGVDLFSYRSRNKVYAYLINDPTFLYLRRDQRWADYYAPLMRRWHNSYNGVDRATIWKPIRKLLKRLDTIRQ